MQCSTQPISISGGYTLLTPVVLCNLLAGLITGRLTFRSARVCLACMAVKAIRDGAFAQKGREKRKHEQRVPHYMLDELHDRIGGVGGEYLQGDLRLLEREGLLTFSSAEITIHQTPTADGMSILEQVSRNRSKTRPIPVPRRMLEYLCRETKPSVFRTALAYLLRGLSLKRDGSIKPTGTMKASLLAQLAGISLRAAKAARKVLIRLGWLSEDTTKSQRKLNRTGAYFVINTAWETPPRGVQKAPDEEAPFSGPTPPSKTPAKSAPPPALSTGEFAPPLRDLNLPNGRRRDQKLGAPSPTGVREDVKRATNEPTLRNVSGVDLQSPARLERLYDQAVAQGAVQPSEANLLNWMAAAIRAKAAKTGEPVRIFMGIVKRGLWHHITQDQEDRARRVLQQHRDREHRGEGLSARQSTVVKTEPSCAKATLDLLRRTLPGLAGLGA